MRAERSSVSFQHLSFSHSWCRIASSWDFGPVRLDLETIYIPQTKHADDTYMKSKMLKAAGVRVKKSLFFFRRPPSQLATGQMGVYG